jgi:hypothetical protein
VAQADRLGLMVSLDDPPRQRWAVFARRLAVRNVTSTTNQISHPLQSMERALRPS